MTRKRKKKKLNFDGLDTSDEIYFKNIEKYASKTEEVVFHEEENAVSFTYSFIKNRNLLDLLSIHLARILKKQKTDTDRNNFLKYLKNWKAGSSESLIFLTIPMADYNSLMEKKKNYES